MQYKRKNIILDYPELKEKVLFNYTGPINIDMLVVIGNNIKKLTYHLKNTSRRLYKIYIELAQNVAAYSAESLLIDNQKIGVGTIILEEQQKYYTFTTRNRVLKHDAVTLMQRCAVINSLDLKGLRHLKREKRLHSDKLKLSAHIGLIHAALLSGNPIYFKVFPLDKEYSYFTIKVKIDKSL